MCDFSLVSSTSNDVPPLPHLCRSILRSVPRVCLWVSASFLCLFRDSVVLVVWFCRGSTGRSFTCSRRFLCSLLNWLTPHLRTHQTRFSPTCSLTTYMSSSQYGLSLPGPPRFLRLNMRTALPVQKDYPSALSYCAFPLELECWLCICNSRTLNHLFNSFVSIPLCPLFSPLPSVRRPKRRSTGRRGCRS